MKNRFFFSKDKLLLSVFLGSVITVSLVPNTQAAFINAVSVYKFFKPVPSSKQVWSETWKDGYNKCKYFFPATKVVRIIKFSPTDDPQQGGKSKYNVIWACGSS